MVLKQAEFRPKTEQSFGRRVKLHGAQALQPLKITNVQVWKKIKLQGSQTEMVHLYCATNTKKLQGTQTNNVGGFAL